jgi:flagellar hook-associated protein 3 FlgL
MAIGPINITRVSHNMRSLSLFESLQRGQVTLYDEQNRVASGRRYLSPSEDPASAAQVLRMTEILDQREQLVLNVRHGDNLLMAADTALTEANDLLVEAHSIASQHLGTLSDAEQRQAAAELVSAIIDQLVNVGNREYMGRYIFAGRNSGLQPFTYARGGIAYTGDAGQLSVRVGAQELEDVSFSGHAVFGALSGRVGGLVDLDPRLRPETRLEDLDGANQKGIRREHLVIVEEGGAGRFLVDLTQADTMADVVDFINDAAEAAGAALTASLTDTGLEITPAGFAVSVTDTSTGLIASDLGVLTPVAQTDPITGADLNVRVTATTPIAELMAGAGVDLTDSILIRNGADEAVVDLSGAETVQDVLNRINNARVNVWAVINEAGTGIEVINLVSGTAMSIGENGGLTATALGIRSLDRDTSLSSLNDGRSVETKEGEDDIRITAKDGSTVDVNLDGVETIGDVIDRINDAATAAGVAIEAGLALVGNGIRIADTTGGAGDLVVSRLNYSYAIDDLGLEQVARGANAEVVSDDTNGVRADSVLTALYDLEHALRENNELGITLAADRLNAFMDDFLEARGVIGARSRGFSDRLTQMENAKYATQEYLSKLRDLDYTEAITRFQSTQVALQASLMTGSRLMSLSLMDYV